MRLRLATLLAPALVTACASATVPARAPSPERSAAPTPSAAASTKLTPCLALPALPAPSASAAPAPAPASGDEATDGAAALDDGFEPPAQADGNASSPLDAIGDAELEAKLAADPSSLGSISLGNVHGGILLNAVAMPEGPHWQLVNPAHIYGTHETIEQLGRALDRVNAEIPGTPRIFLGDFSAKNGGHLPPHVSHQNGRDVDVGYYYLPSAKGEPARWYAAANASNLDTARTWALVQALVEGADVEMILMDTGVQKLVKQRALESGEDPAWLDAIFQVGGKATRPLIFYAPGHATHLHVRFYAPESRELGRRAYAFLLKRKLIKPPTYFVDHVVKPGETLGVIAAKYKTSIDAIKKANHMTSSVVQKGKAYKVPQIGGVERPPGKVVAPARRLPPAKAMANVAPPPRASAQEPASSAPATSPCAPPG